MKTLNVCVLFIETYTKYFENINDGGHQQVVLPRIPMEQNDHGHHVQ